MGNKKRARELLSIIYFILDILRGPILKLNNASNSVLKIESWLRIGMSSGSGSGDPSSNHRGGKKIYNLYVGKKICKKIDIEEPYHLIVSIILGILCYV